MRRAVLILAAVATLVAGGAVAAAAAPGSERAAKPTLTVRSSSFGRILFDGRGFVLYAFTRDPKKRSACSGACASAWPPHILKGRLVAGKRITKSLLGTTRRADGARQVTYAGRPLYYYVGDRRAGQILCQNVREFGGLWLVVRPSGALVR
jgi:predicted lipoprotein with Yx(FWY)xxD motif